MAEIERKKRIYRKRIPYGMQNFEDVIERDCYYVDKTVYTNLKVYHFLIKKCTTPNRLQRYA